MPGAAATATMGWPEVWRRRGAGLAPAGAEANAILAVPLARQGAFPARLALFIP
jgi:hypothetical protein